MRGRVAYSGIAAAFLSGALVFAAPDPLPSWNDGTAKRAIVAFVEAALREGSATFVPAPERIAVFDNDGTLWAEQPIYFQLAFAVDRVKVMAPQHPEWKSKEPFGSILAGDLKGALAGGEKAIGELIMATHAGMTTDEFAGTAGEWLRTARHPRFKRRYDECVYQPMLEVLALLRSHGFKTYIVSGGGVEFMRVFSEKTYGVPPEQVIGSAIATRYEMRGGAPVLVREPKVDFVDDKEGKPVGIDKFIGRRPVFAFGNSDGDLEMLRWTAAAGGARFSGVVRHTDAAREWVYDRQSPIGRLDNALDEAGTRGWTVVDMKRDWRKVFPFD
jgi:phosphoserine phosphatase